MKKALISSYILWKHFSFSKKYSIYHAETPWVNQTVLFQYSELIFFTCSLIKNCTIAYANEEKKGKQRFACLTQMKVFILKNLARTLVKLVALLCVNFLYTFVCMTSKFHVKFSVANNTQHQMLVFLQTLYFVLRLTGLSRGILTEGDFYKKARKQRFFCACLLPLKNGRIAPVLEKIQNKKLKINVCWLTNQIHEFHSGKAIKKEKDIVYLYSPLTSPFSFNPLMDFEFHHWSLLKRITTDNIKGVTWELTPLT